MNISKKLFFLKKLLVPKNLFVSCLILFNYQSKAHYTDPISRVEQIETSDELHGQLSSKKPKVILLKSEHCPYCTIFAKTFEKAAEKHKSIKLLTADGKKLNAPKIVSDYTKEAIKIPGYPSILFIKNGKISDYQIGGNPTIFAEKLAKLLK